MKFNFNINRIRFRVAPGQRSQSRMVVISITRGKGALNGFSRERQPFRDIAFRCAASDNLLVAGQANKFARPGPARFGFSFFCRTKRRIGTSNLAQLLRSTNPHIAKDAMCGAPGPSFSFYCCMYPPTTVSASVSSSRISFPALTTTKLKFNVLNPEGVICMVPMQLAFSVYVPVIDGAVT
jgi:hypothetical protein